MPITNEMAEFATMAFVLARRRISRNPHFSGRVSRISSDTGGTFLFCRFANGIGDPEWTLWILHESLTNYSGEKILSHWSGSRSRQGVIRPDYWREDILEAEQLSGLSFLLDGGEHGLLGE
jgi:hypothetical protein